MKMKRAYNKILGLLMYLPVCMEILKCHIFERIKMIKDRRIYTKQLLTEKEKSRIDSYWIAHYGKKINRAWHKYYKSYTGNLDEKYFPQILYSTKLAHRLNPWHYTLVLSDKNLMTSLFSDTVCCPATYGKRCGKHYSNQSGDVVSKGQFIGELADIGKVVVKPTVGSSSGQGIKVCEIKNGVDLVSQRELTEILETYPSDFVIQQYVEQSEYLSRIYPHSVNTFRVITYIANDQIHVAPIAMRFGAQGNIVDNIHAGGLMIGIDKDGTLKEYAYLEYGERFTEHPDTHIPFKNYRIPFVDRIEETAKRLHKKVPCLGMISWDFTLNEKNEVVLVEVNLKGQSVCFMQEVHGKGLFEENTPYMLSLIR